MKTHFICLILALLTLALLPVTGWADQVQVEQEILPWQSADGIPLPPSTGCDPPTGEPYPVGPALPPPVSITLSPKVMWLVHPPVDVHEFDWIW